MTERIGNKARESGVNIVGRIRYDRAVTKAQIRKKAVAETDATIAQDIKQIWNCLNT
ncbi:MAG: hypothetical protein PHN98_05105 [Smithellaceae bacterium]|nr:hypothetical protein [Smithellaceae bacterium]